MTPKSKEELKKLVRYKLSAMQVYDGEIDAEAEKLVELYTNDILDVFTSYHQQQLEQAVREARLDEVERIPNPAIIAIDGRRKEPMLEYKNSRFAELQSELKNDKL